MKEPTYHHEIKLELSETIKSKHKSRILKLSEFQKSLISVDVLEYVLN